MQPRLLTGAKPRAGEVGVGVAGEKERLEEQQADGPNRGRTAEPRQDRLGDHGLDLEEEKCARENRGGVDEGQAAVGRYGRRVIVVGSHAILSRSAAASIATGSLQFNGKCGAG